MRLITVLSLAKEPQQIKLELDLAGKGAQYRLIGCFQFATKDDEKVNKYSENSDFVGFISHFSYRKQIFGSH